MYMSWRAMTVSDPTVNKAKDLHSVHVLMIPYSLILSFILLFCFSFVVIYAFAVIDVIAETLGQ